MWREMCARFMDGRSTLEYLDLGWGTMVQYFLQIMVHVFKHHVDISPIDVIICTVHRIKLYAGKNQLTGKILNPSAWTTLVKNISNQTKEKWVILYLIRLFHVQNLRNFLNKWLSNVIVLMHSIIYLEMTRWTFVTRRYYNLFQSDDVLMIQLF